MAVSLFLLVSSCSLGTPGPEVPACEPILWSQGAPIPQFTFLGACGVPDCELADNCHSPLVPKAFKSCLEAVTYLCKAASSQFTVGKCDEFKYVSMVGKGEVKITWLCDADEKVVGVQTASPGLESECLCERSGFAPICAKVTVGAPDCWAAPDVSP